MHRTIDVSSLFIILCFVFFLISDGCSASPSFQHLFGGAATTATVLETQTATDAGFTAVGAVNVMPDGTLIMVDDMVKRLNPNTSLVTPVPLAWEDSPSETFFRLKAGIKGCNDFIYDRWRDKLYMTCSNGIAVVKGNIIQIMIPGNGALEAGNYTSTYISNAAALTMTRDGKYLMFISASLVPAKNKVVKVELDSKTIESFDFATIANVKTLIACNESSAAGEVIYLTSNQIFKYNFLSKQNERIFSSTSDVRLFCNMSSTDGSFIRVSTAGDVSSVSGDGNVTLIRSALVSSPLYASMVGDYLFLLSTAGVTRYSFSANVSTLVAIHTSEATNNLFDLTSLSAVNIAQNAIHAVNGSFAYLFHPTTLRTMDIAQQRVSVLLRAGNTPSYGISGTTLVSAEIILPSAADEVGNIYFAGMCNPNCAAIYKLRPSATYDKFYLSRIAGSSAPGLKDGPYGTNTATFTTDPWIALKYPYLYFGSDVVRRLDLKTLMLSTLTTFGASRIDGPLTKATTYELRGAAVISNSTLVLLDATSSYRVLDLDKQSLTTITEIPVGANLRRNLVTCTGNALISLIPSTTGGLSIIIDNKYHVQFGCVALECQSFPAFSSAMSTGRISAYGNQLFFIETGTHKVYKWVMETPSPPAIIPLALNSTAAKVSFPPEPSKWGGVFTAPTLLLRYNTYPVLPQWITITVPFTESVTIPNLKPGGIYTFCAALQTVMGTSQESCTTIQMP